MLRFFKDTRDGGIVCEHCLDDQAAPELDPRLFPGTWALIACARCGNQPESPAGPDVPRPGAAAPRLPVHRPAAPASRPRLAFPEDPPPRVMGARLLLIEDEDMVRLALETTLADAGYAVTAVASGSAAVEAVSRGGRPDLIITDWRLGEGETGREALRKLRPVLGRRVPVVVLTGEPGRRPFHVLDSIDADVLLKPVDARGILEAIARRLRRAQT